MELHERLREALKEHGLSQKQISAELNVSTATVSGWLTGAAPCGEVQLARIVTLLKPLTRDEQKLLLAQLLHLRLRGRIAQEEAGWTPDLRSRALSALDLLRPTIAASLTTPRTGGVTLQDFPDAFYPLTVITGDRRETSKSRINEADFGAVSASPAETRWIGELQLRRDVEFLTDKVFVLESADQLRQRFSQRNLLVVGSPGSNHLARRIHLCRPIEGWRPATPIFRFNPPQATLQEIEALLESLKTRRALELPGVQIGEQTERQVKHWLLFLFAGGILDPSYEFKLRALVKFPNVDFGLVSLARNPFSDDDRFVTILAAGFHMFGTAHAVRMLSKQQEFERHPFGGVLRVTMDLGLTFAERFDQSKAAWDTNSEYSKESLLEGLEHMFAADASMIDVDTDTVKQTIEFVASR